MEGIIKGFSILDNVINNSLIDYHVFCIARIPILNVQVLYIHSINLTNHKVLTRNLLFIFIMF